MSEDNLPRTFITKKDKATFTCPSCGKAEIKDVARFKDVDKPYIIVKCKCPCGHTYRMRLERRQEIRKNVGFVGTFTAGEKGMDTQGRMTIMDISRSGLRFKTHLPYQFEKDEKVFLEFTLENEEQSLIKREVVVRGQHGTSVGASFVSRNHYDKLGAYLLYSM